MSTAENFSDRLMMVKMPPKGLFLSNIVALPSGKQEGGNVGLFGQSQQSKCFEVKRTAKHESAEIDLKCVFEKSAWLSSRKCACTRLDTRENESLDNKAFISWPFKKTKLLSERLDGFLIDPMTDVSRRTCVYNHPEIEEYLPFIPYYSWWQHASETHFETTKQ